MSADGEKKFLTQKAGGARFSALESLQLEGSRRFEASKLLEWKFQVSGRRASGRAIVAFQISEGLGF